MNAQIKTRYLQGSNRIDNWDHYAVYQTDTLFICCVCDGAISGKGGEAAKIVAESLCHYIASTFDALYDARWVRRRFMVSQYINQVLRKKNDTSYAEYTTTVMAVAADTSGRMMAIHLGDGTIEKYDNGKYMTISSPEQGVVRGSTYLTGDETIYKNLRVYAWQDTERSGEYILRTDGASEWMAGLQATSDDATVITFALNRTG